MNRKIRKRSQLIVMLIVVIALIGVLVINSDNASADQTAADALANKNTADTEQVYDSFTTSALPSLFKVGSALVIVIVAIYVGLFLLKRMMGKKYSGNRQNNIMEVLETTYIGPKKTISLIKVANKAVLVASTETQISMLTEMDSVETKEILGQIAVEEKEDQFKNIFKAATEKIKELSVKRETKSLVDVQPTTKS